MKLGVIAIAQFPNA
jgi:hypothetical protein